jgi:Zn-dependent peptidase ImmA (M78 family)
MTKINPEILKWARETAGFSLEEASKKINLGPAYGMLPSQRLNSYEQGEDEPSRSLLTRMAKQYRRPLLVFYLKEPPKVADRGQDFRVLPKGYTIENQALVDALLRDIRVRQSIIRNAMLDDKDVKELKFIGSMEQGKNFAEYTDTIKNLLKLDIQEYYRKSTQSEAFNFLRSRLEAIGVFVLLIGDLGSYHTSLDTSVFRGFALSDNIAPFIVINDNDSKPAWSFTLIHEFTHLLLGQTGISSSYANNRIEKLCNSVASHVLLQNYELDSLDLNRIETLSDIAEKISIFAEQRNLSNSMVAYRLFLNDVIVERQWQDLRTFFIKKWIESREKSRQAARTSTSGPSYYIIRKHRLGENLISTVQNMTFEGQLTTIKAGKVLGVAPTKIQNLFDLRLPQDKVANSVK